MGRLSLNIPAFGLEQFDFLQKVFDRILRDLGWADRMIFMATGSVLEEKLLDLNLGALYRNAGVYAPAWSRFYLTVPSLDILSTGDWLALIQKVLKWMNPDRFVPGSHQIHDMWPIEGARKSMSSVLHVTLNDKNL